LVSTLAALAGAKRETPVDQNDENLKAETSNLIFYTFLVIKIEIDNNL